MEINRIVKNAEDFLRNWREPVFFNGLVFRGLERRVDRTKIVRVFCIRNSKSTITQKKPPRGRFLWLTFINLLILRNKLAGKLRYLFEAFIRNCSFLDFGKNFGKFIL